MTEAGDDPTVSQQELRALWGAYRDASKRLGRARVAGDAEQERQLIAETDAALKVWGQAKDAFFSEVSSAGVPHDWLIEVGDDGKPAAVMKPNGTGLYDEHYEFRCSQCGTSIQLPAKSYQGPAGTCIPAKQP